MADENEQVVKGGVCWIEYGVDRNVDGLEIFVRTVPEIEDFFKKTSNGVKGYVSLYGRDWLNKEKGKDIEIYDASDALQNGSKYNLRAVCEPMEGGRDGRINLSFLRFVGVSGPNGITFVIPGPFSKDYVRKISANLLTASKEFVGDYIIPIHINLRLSSQEL